MLAIPIAHASCQEDILVNSYSRDLDELGDALLLKLVNMTFFL
jgi:hypothetical protein